MSSDPKGKLRHGTDRFPQGVSVNQDLPNGYELIPNAARKVGFSYRFVTRAVQENAVKHIEVGTFSDGKRRRAVSMQSLRAYIKKRKRSA